MRLRTVGRVGFPLLLLAASCRTGGRGPVSPAPPPTPAGGGPPAAVDLRFFAVGDTGTGEPDQFAVGRAIAEKCRTSRCDFGVLLGDNFYPDGVTSADDPQWQSKFERPYAELLAAGQRFFAVLGNHDYADGADLGRGAHQVAHSRADPRFVLPAPHYTFAEGPARFVALDTQMLLARDEVHAEQERLLTSAAAHSGGTPRPWLIGLGHHPYLSNGTNGNAPRRLARFLEDVVCRHADLYLAGHDHNLQVLSAPGCGALLVVSGGGGYATYAVGDRQPALFQAQTLGFAYVIVTAQTLRVEMIDGGGQTLFSHERAR